MILSEWHIEDDTLFIRDAHDLILAPANEIYAYVFQQTSTIKGLNPSPPNHFKFSRFPLDIVLHFEMDYRSGNILLSICAEEGIHILEFKDFFSREADHVVVDGIWYPLVKDRLKYVQSSLRKFGITQTGSVPLGVYLKIRDDPDLIVNDEIDSFLVPEGALAPDIAHVPPAVFTGNLYPYQHQGYKWLSFIDKHDVGCILADEMGLGKTIQIIALLSEYTGVDNPSVVICPATLLENWKREISKFAPGLRTIIHQGRDRAGIVADLLHYNVVITSYDSAVRDRYMLKMHSWNIIILDEVQAIKNPFTHRAKAVKSFPRRSAVAVTGTPVQNNLVDLWSIVDFVLPDYFGTLSSFKKQYLMNVQSARRLEPRLAPIMLRRTLDDVAIDLPALIDIPQALRLGFHGAAEYNLVRQQIIDQYPGNYSLVMLQKLRMYCAHRNLVMDSRANPADKSVKYNRLLEILDEVVASREKAIIFTSWQQMIDILVSDIKSRFNIYTDFLDGRTPVQDRQKNIDRFNALERSGVLVLNPIAGGVGLNITGANHVIHYNLEWNPAVVDQATKRAYRIGQKKPVRVYIPYYVDTVEEVVNDRLEFKRDVASNVVIGVRGTSNDYQDIIRALGKTPQDGGEN